VVRGKVMYELSFPTIGPFDPPLDVLNFVGQTWVLDTSTMMWHQKQYTDPATGINYESYTNYYAQAGSFILAGSPKDNNIYQLSSDIYTDKSNIVYRYRKTKIFTNDFKQITVNSVEVKCLVGQAGTGQSFTASSVASFTEFDNLTDTVINTAFPKNNFSGNVQGFPVYTNTLNMDGTNTIELGPTDNPPSTFSNWFNLVAGDMIAFQPTTPNNMIQEGWQTIYLAEFVSKAYIVGVSSTITVKFLSTAIPTGSFPSPFQYLINPIAYINTRSQGQSLDPTTVTYCSTNPVLAQLANPAATFTLNDATTFTTPLQNVALASFPQGPVNFQIPDTTNSGVVIGNSFTVSSSRTVSSITLTGSPTLSIGQRVNITLNDSSVIQVTILTINGSTFTFSSTQPVLVDDLTIGNAVNLINNSTPSIDMRFSIDSGNTWSAWESQTLGVAGAYGTRCIWNLLGTAQEWELEFRIIANVKFSIVEAVANVTMENQ
jgi:hypothetical protein